MLIPLHDQDFSIRKTPWITWMLILFSIIIYGFPFFLANLRLDQYELTPNRILEEKNWHTLFTYLFIHISLWHLIANSYFLWLFGDNVEKALGRIRFLTFYLFSGALTALAYVLYLTKSEFIPLAGASGAISAVLGLYLILFPENNLKAFLILPPLFLKIITVRSFIFIAFWFILQFALARLIPSLSPSYLIHIIGFMLGAGLGLMFKKQLIVKDYNAS